MSISSKELIALRRARMQQKSLEESNKAKEKPVTAAAAAAPSRGAVPARSYEDTNMATATSSVGRAGPAAFATSAHSQSTAAGSEVAGDARHQPKVLAPNVFIRGELPRDELVSRKRERFHALGPLERLLEERGVSSAGGFQTGEFYSLLPLEAFDDETFEERAPAVWQSYLEDPQREAAQGEEEEEEKGLPCRAFTVNSAQGTTSWSAGRVVGYEPKSNAYTVQLLAEDSAAPNSHNNSNNDNNNNSKHNMKTLVLPRVCVCFDVENPIQFADRFTSAYRRRKMAERIIRANLYVECIPPDEYQTIDPVVLERVKQMAFSTPKLIEAENHLDSQVVLSEIRADYSRTMNADLLVHTAPNISLSKTNNEDVEIPRAETLEVPLYGIAPQPPKRFQNVLASFRQSSFMVALAPIVQLRRQIKSVNERLLSQTVFLLWKDLEVHRPLSVVAFDDAQTLSIRESAQLVRDKWAEPIFELTKGTLEKFSNKDEVSLSYYLAENYANSKTQHLLTSINYEMEEMLRHMLKSAIEAFTRFLEDNGNVKADIRSFDDVRLEVDDFPAPTTPFGSDDRITRLFLTKPSHHSPPLFKITLVENNLNDAIGMTKRPGTGTEKKKPIEAEDEKDSENGNDDGDDEKQAGAERRAKGQAGQKEKAEDQGVLFYYKSNTEIISTVLTTLIGRTLQQHADTRTVERRLFEFLYDPTTAFVRSVSSDDPFVQSCLARMHAVLERVADAMARYLDLFKVYNELGDMDIATYIEQFKQKFPRTKGVEAEIKKYVNLQKEILEKIPTETNLGFVSIDMVDMRRRLSSKCGNVAARILDVMASRALGKENEVHDNFCEIHDTLTRAVNTPEEVVATKDFIKTIPEKVFELQLAIQEIREMHDVLDSFHRGLSDDEFDKKWRTIAWPSQLDDTINTRVMELEEAKRSLVSTMNRSQEQFDSDVAHLQKVVEGYAQHCTLSRAAEIATDVRNVQQQIQQLREQANTFNTHESLFNLEKTDYSAVHQLATDFEPYASLWLTIDHWATSTQKWKEAVFNTIDAEDMEQQVTEDYKVIGKCCRSTLLSPDLIEIAESVHAQIEEFKPTVPVVKSLRTDGMKERHWEQLSKEIGKEVNPLTTLTSLANVKELGLMASEETVLRVSEIASREYQIEVSLARMKAVWSDLRLNVKSYKETGCYILGKDVIDDTQETLDDQVLTTQSLTFSPFKKLFEEDITTWEASLTLVQNVLDEWLRCQKSWLYLEPIFQSEDIARQLPAEDKRFQQVNKNWRFLTGAAHTVDLIMPFCVQTENCLGLLRENNELLEIVEKGLNQYLESKRASFARFYFLSDDELLTILSEARDPQKIQPQFRKLFENIAKIDMRLPDNEMFGMYSQMNEYIPFSQPVAPRKYVENWLTEIETMMKLSIRAQLEKGVKDFTTMDRETFILKSPGQVAIAVSQIMWTYECERTLKEHGSLAPYAPTAMKNLMVLVETVRKPLSNLQRMNLSGLITIEVHARDIVEQLAKDGVDSVFAFEWVSQLRSYWESNDCFLRQVEAQFRYGGEYLGNTTRLVITPLTDRIYLTLTGAMHMFLGGAPAGPAGTGKTETVKDLAKAVAKQCVVFNCQEGMTFASMGKFFKGLAQSGAWACFDEFNRIDVEVLSVVAQQVSSLQEAARTRQYRIPFEGTEIVVDPSYSVFITMNPGYAGRTELPDNLKVLFRPVACMVPDYAMIAEIRLFSFGYAESRKLAQKMVATFRLSSEQLSSQDHYDFGMRAVNTVIAAAGLMKREHPDEAEDVLLLRALRDSNAPKFLDEDLLLFDGIISDLFPGLQLTPSDYGDFVVVLRETAAEMNLQPTTMFIKKCVELYEMSVLRHGQMSVGPTMGGKTCATRVLQAAMTKMRTEKQNERFSVVKTYSLNPKSITMAQLYGGFDDATGEWREGLVGELFRTAARDTTEARHWIVFDGPVDALWIESMNTVLDDNKKLCLISGEIIAMTPYMGCWFEVEDLAVASPATVSRAGMIYFLPDTCIGVSSFIKSWQMYELPSTMDPYKESLQELCDRLFPSLIQFVQTQVTEYSPSVWPNLMTSCFKIFSCFMEPYTPTRTYDVTPEMLDLLRENYLHILVFSIVWSFGVTGDRASRQKFDKFLRDELRLRGVNIELPVIGCLLDYQFLPEERLWVSWTERLPPFAERVTAANMADIIVPTADVVRYKYISKLLLTHSYHTLCCGPTGTGKSVLLEQLLMNEMPKQFTPIFFTFSARTSANQTQDLIFSKLEVRRRATPQIWGAPLNKKFVVKIDDMNMPMKEQYGAQPPIEVLRQFMDYSGWYDRKTREFFNIVDVIYVAAMGPPGGGRNQVSNRFLRHFNQIAFPEIDDENMKRIYTSLLDSYFSAFPEDIRAKVGTLVSASIEVFNTVSKELRPTPARPHYLFNLRDLSKVMGGVIYAKPKTITSVNALARLWMHEEKRTFADRLVSAKDSEWFDALLQKQIAKQFKLSYDEVMPPKGENSPCKELLFCDFMGPKTDQRTYAEVTDFNELVRTLEKQIEEYNAQSTTNHLNLVMFADAVQHVCRISRVLGKPNGHVLLLGVGGSGRQSLSRLAAHLSDLELKQVEISKGYTVNAWREDIKAVLRTVAFKNKQVLFLFTDTQIVFESMLEDVNNLLNSGEVPNLFLGPEFDDLLNAMKPICISENVPLDKVSVFGRFVRGCRVNLHISLCMSPLGEVFRSRLRMFPSLVNCCTIDWFSAWPDQALRSVAKQNFSDFELLTSEAEIEACTEVCVDMHLSVEEVSRRFLGECHRYNYVTPTSFLELLRTFRELLAERTTANNQTKNRLQNGLTKLKETEDAVAGLQQMLAENQPILLEKNESIKKLVAEMEVQTRSAEETKKEAEKEQAAVAAKQAECAGIESEAQEQLAEALPELDRALESLKNLKSSQITEVSGYKAPTPGVIMTMQGICILFQIKPMMKAANPMEEKKPDYWSTAREQLLSNPNQLLQKLFNFDKEHIPEKLIQQVMPLVSSEDFTPKRIAGASQACAAMCQWTHAMVRFHEVNKKVEPLRERLAVAQEANQEAQTKLQAAEARLEQVARSLEEMQRSKENAEAEMKELDATVKNTELKLERAAMLIDGLAGEKKNWIKTIEDIAEKLKFVTGDMLVAAGQVAYCGAFIASYRKDLLEKWRETLENRSMLHSDQLSVFYSLQDPVQTREWGINGLPQDLLSVENALFLANARRWPLMIDPQTQANKWIKQTYKDSLEVLKPSQRDLVKRIEYCIRAGRSVLLENVTEEIDASLNPLLGRQTFFQGGTEMIRISDTAIPWNDNFKFFMTTKLPNPHYTPEVMVRVTLLNFFITPQGLEDQLLSVVVGQERKELETRRSDLIQKNAAMKADLANIQKTILKKLEEVKGDVLDDVELIAYLNESKEKTIEITTKVAEAEEAEKEINATREEYRSVAHHAACLYFCCSTLSNVDPMYQYSLQWFVQLFIAGIDQSARSDELEKRLQNLSEYFTYSFYQNVSRSLFEKHKLMFSFFLCIRIAQQDNKVNEAEFRFLLQGPTMAEKAGDNPDPSWIVASTWGDLCYLAKHFSCFDGFIEHFKANLKAYQELFMSSNAHKQPLPDGWMEKLTPMQHMLFLRCLRPDKLMEAVQAYVADQMGEQFIRPPQFDLLTSYKDATAMTPLIFILSQGADPYEDWKKFAETQHMSKKLYDISLGQGQGPRAERMLQEAMENGAWVLLQNCHLATSWMPSLERVVESMTSAVHPNFRLWLTSMPSPHFPVSVLQNGVKMTNEPPKGMQANVTRSILSYSNDYLETCKKTDAFKKLFFSFTFFHALIQERRKFGALGWNIAYEYTSGDLGCCVDQVKMFLDKYDEVPYKVIRELSGNIHYGGRVTDDWDRRTLNTLLESFVCPDVMTDGYCFTSLDTYRSIPATSQQGYLEYVAQWPLNTHPETFGLHENADIACARGETFETLEAVVKLQGEASAAASSGKSADEVVEELAASIQGRVSQPFDIDKFRKKYPTRYEDSMNTVLVQEAIRFNKLVAVLHLSLASLPLAIKGEVVMSKDLEEVYRSLVNNQVPTVWADRAYPSLKPLAAWVEDLRQRLDMIQAWFDNGHPKTYWISGFFFPQAFLTGILQNYARRKQISIDTISYDFEWIDRDPATVTAGAEEGCYIYGMYIEGARVDPTTLKLAESKPKVLFETTPLLWLRPVIDRVKPTSGVYECPLYKTLQRAGTLSTTGHSTNYVLTVEVPTTEDGKHWIRRGVAMICALGS